MIKKKSLKLKKHTKKSRKSIFKRDQSTQSQNINEYPSQNPVLNFYELSILQMNSKSELSQSNKQYILNFIKSKRKGLFKRESNNGYIMNSTF